MALGALIIKEKLGTSDTETVEQRRARREQRRKAIKKQLQYIKRNLATIEKLATQTDRGRGLEVLRPREYRMLLVVSEVYRQQHQMYAND